MDAGVVRHEYASWIGQEPFDFFLTITSGNRSSPESMLKGTRFVLRRFAEFCFGKKCMRRGLTFEGIIATERQKSGNPHTHSLLRGPVPGMWIPLGVFHRIANDIMGISRIEIPRGQSAVTAYCAKYSIKQGELFFTPGFTPQSIQRSL